MTEHSRTTVLHTLPDLQLGGGQLVVLAQIKHADRKRFRHVVCAIRDSGDMGGRFEDAGTEVITLGAGGVLSVPGAIGRLSREIRARSVDIVHTNNTAIDRLVGQRAAAKTGVPVVNTCHWALPARRRLRDLPRDRFARWLAHGAVQRAVAVSDVVRASWLGWYRSIGVGNEQIVTVHPGLDLATFDDGPGREAMRASLGLGDCWPVLVNVARMDPGKGQMDLIPLMGSVRERHPQAMLLIVGDGVERQNLEQAVAESGLGDAIWLLGRRDDVPAVLRACDLFVFTSYSESFGLVVIEAMAAGLPVAAYGLPAFKEIVTEASGVLIGDKEPGPLAEAVLGVLDGRAGMAAMGAAGRGRVEGAFAVERSVRAVEAVYDDMLAGRSRREPSA